MLLDYFIYRCVQLRFFFCETENCTFGPDLRVNTQSQTLPSLPDSSAKLLSPESVVKDYSLIEKDIC